MKEITIKVFSYCDDFTEEEKDILAEIAQGTDCYIDYSAHTEESMLKNGWENDIISNKLIRLGCIDGEDVLIKIDW